jgi:hypothetical protein
MVPRLGKRTTVLATAVGLAITGVIGGGLRPTSGQQLAGPPVGGCQLSGTATFSTPIKATPQSVTYTFTGSFTNCKGTTSVKSGTVTASGAGSLSCAEGRSSGSATISWNNGTSSTASFSTTSAAAATAITGKITGGTFAGDSSVGAIVFSTTTPQACASTGLTTLKFSGVEAVG